ncbi:pikachurin [Anopheles nili]|uniref:pikachurin n=1 Tax=Anopheles nili TaxID=185578 RepID=UPI00237C4DAF|nr:pikachurin [Anopheles nili]
MWLFGFSLVVIVCAAKCTEADISVEAAFQGRCGHGSPCEQLCYELHDGMYECDCSEGFELNKNGYSCQEINSTSTDENASNGEEDVLYQRGASFSAKLDISDLHISMKSFDDDDDDDDDDKLDGSRKGSPPKPGHPSVNSIGAGDELARRKANHNWKLAPAPKQPATGPRKSNRKEKSIQSDAPAVGDGKRHDQQQQQQQHRQQKPAASGAGDRRKLNATSAIHHGILPPASDMEISGISLHAGGEKPRWARARSVKMVAPEVASASAATGADGASEIRALPLMAGSLEDDDDDDDDDDDGGRGGKLPPEVMQGVNGDGALGEVRENVTQPALEDATISIPCTLDCGPEGICHVVVEASSTAMRCLCAFGKSGLRCEEDNKVNTPRFSKHSWIAFPALRGAYKHVQLHVEFRPESFDGILLLTGERDDLTGDFMALLLHQGFVEFWFDCGSGMGRVKSEETIVLNQWNTITIYRHRWDAWLVLNQGNRVQGRSKGLFSRITFREPVFLGGYGNITGLDRKLPVSTGFTGCIRKFVANDHDYNFQQGSVGDVSHGFDIQECITDRCSRYPCQHGGKCLPSDDGAICLCPLGFGGDLCEMRLDLQVPSFNGSSYLRYAPLGDSCIIWFELKIIIKPLLEDGLLLYSGHHEYGDYISLCLNMGYVEFTYDLGSGPATVRSEFPLTMGQWHTIKVSRTSRLAVLKIDQLPEVMTVSPNGFWHLSLPHSLYLGGIHNVHTLPTSLRDRGSFAGCIQKVDINDRTIAIISEALGGSNVENCPHACVARPCGPLAKCVPNLDTYECQCNPQNRQCNKAEELPSEVIEKQQRLLKRKQHESNEPHGVQVDDSEPTQPLTTPVGTSASVSSSSTQSPPPEDSTLPHDNIPSDAGDGSSEESDEGYNDYYQSDADDDDDGDDYTPSGVGSEIKTPPNEPAKQSKPTATVTTVDANEKIIVWIDRQKSKGSFSTQSNEYADYGGEILAEDSDAPDGVPMVRQDEGHSLYDPSAEASVVNDARSALTTPASAGSEGAITDDDMLRDDAVRDNRRTSGRRRPEVGGWKMEMMNRANHATNRDDDDDGDDDGYGKDYDQHGDRIPYRPDFLLHRKDTVVDRVVGSRAERRHRGQPGPEIDETLIEEMNRIMKNHNDNDADEAPDAGFWGVASSDTAFGGPSEYDELESEDPAGGGHHREQQHHHQQRPVGHHRRRNGVENEEPKPDAMPQPTSGDDARNDEDDILRSIKYKNKYFRKYQGACFTGTDSYFHYSDAETMRRVIAYEIDLNLRFKTHSANGLILWTGRHSALEGDDFLSLGVENGYLHLRYNLGSGEINIKYNATKVSDGLWHRVRALRNSQDGTLKVDGGKPITRRSPGKLRQLNTDTGLYVGGLPAATHYTRQRYRAGMVGCISELILAGELRLNFDATILGTAHNVEPGAP